MKAIVYTKYRPPGVFQLKEHEKPIPKDNEILIKIYTMSVTSGDCRLRKADPFAVILFNSLIRPKKITILGNELAGEIESIGKNVKQFNKGDQLFGQAGLNLGTNAEYICLPETGTITNKPANITYEEAAIIPFGGNTTLHFFRKANIRSGQKVLIYGASGSVGPAAVQPGKYFGAEVTGVCNTHNIELVKSLGADDVIDYTKEDFTKNGHKFDIIFDTTVNSPFTGCVNSLKQKGTDLRAVHMKLKSVTRGLCTFLTRSKKVIGGIAIERKENLYFLKQHIEDGKLKPVKDRHYPLEQIAEAHR
jgi:NADPH:quinone reductase-like Zn-dependent oxidoreductase